MKDKKFIVGIERLIRPMEVGALLFAQTFNRLVPARIMVKLVRANSKKSPYMGFVVEPYSLFLCHEIKNIKKAQSLIPDRFNLIKTKIFATDKPAYYFIVGTFNTHTSGFWGTRQESYIIAEDTNTGLLSWIIIDINTNTISVEPKKGVVDPNSKDAVFTINSKGKIVLDIQNDDGPHHLSLECDTTMGRTKKLDQRLWLEGNLSIDYGKEFTNGTDDPFSVIFDPAEVEEALDIPLKAAVITKNSLFSGMIQKAPSKIVCFPYSQHFASDSPGNQTQIKNKKELVRAYNKLGDLSQFEAFSGDVIRKQIMIGGGISATISTSIIFYLIYHFLSVH